MPGLISAIFDPSSDDMTDSDRSAADAHQGSDVAASPSVDVGMSGHHENGDGSSSDWSHETHVGADASLDATIAAATNAADETA